MSNENNQKLVKSEINKYLQTNILNFLYKTSLEYNSDIIGFKGYFRKNFLVEDDFSKYNWDELYPKISFNVESQTFLDFGSLFLKN